jgi:hypothetical protein
VGQPLSTYFIWIFGTICAMILIWTSDNVMGKYDHWICTAIWFGFGIPAVIGWSLFRNWLVREYDKTHGTENSGETQDK